MNERKRRNVEMEYISEEKVQQHYGIDPEEFKKEQDYFDPDLNTLNDDELDEKCNS